MYVTHSGKDPLQLAENKAVEFRGLIDPLVIRISHLLALPASKMWAPSEHI